MGHFKNKGSKVWIVGVLYYIFVLHPVFVKTTTSVSTKNDSIWQLKAAISSQIFKDGALNSDSMIETMETLEVGDLVQASDKKNK